MQIIRPSSLFFVLAAGSLPLLSGCSLNPVNSPASSANIGAFEGRVHGGPNPVVGATVTLYETQVGASSTYGSAGKVLATAITGPAGQFAFNNTGAGAYTCDTGPYMQYAYIAVTGGNTGANASNGNSVLMAALGPCSNLATVASQSATQIFVSEATTVAAAYALSNFMTISGSAGAQVVQVGSTPTNDAALPACTNTGTLVCNANGLGHAFNNAVNLASGVSFNGLGVASGTFNSAMPSYQGSVIPAALLNTVADAVQSCVNSPGLPTDGSASACGNLFTYTTTPSGTAPANTLAAAINIAKYPANPATIGSAGIYSLVTPNAYFQPTLAAAPADYSLGVFYPGVSNGTTYVGYPYALALDIADDLYVLSADTGTPSTFGATPTTGTITTTGVASFTQNSGLAPLYAYTSNNSTTLTVPGGLAVDSSQNVFASNPGNSATTNSIRKFSGPSGALLATYAPTFGTTATSISFGSSMSVDKANNLWLASQNPATSTSVAIRAAIYQIPQTGTANGALTTVNSTNYSLQLVGAGGNMNGLAIDQAQNVWSCGQGGNKGAPMTGNAPTINSFPNTGGGSGTVLYSTQQLASALGGNSVGGPAIDSAGNVYCPFRLAIAYAATTGAAVAANPTVTTQAYTAGMATPPNGAQMDGAGTYVTGSRAATGKLYTVAITSTAAGTTPFASTTPVTLDPCYPVTTSQGVYCSNNSTIFTGTGLINLLNNSNSFQIDSTGSVWSTVGASGTAAGPVGLVQLIGTMAPVWPQLSYGKPGVRP